MPARRLPAGRILACLAVLAAVLVAVPAAAADRTPGRTAPGSTAGDASEGGYAVGDPAGDPEPAPGPQVLTGIAYAPGGPGHLLDLYLPARTGRPAPLVIWSHGSAWVGENGRDDANVVAAALGPRGYAVAGVALRSSTHARFPAQLYDVKAAIRYLRANAARYRLDPGRFAIIGESSGGWAAEMAAVTGYVPAVEGTEGVLGVSSGVQAAVSFYAPTAFLRMDAMAREVTGRACRPVAGGFRAGDCHDDAGSPESLLLGCAVVSCPAAVHRADPVTWADRRAPPMLLLHGRRDALVPWQQSLTLYQALRRSGADATLVTLPRGGHGQWAAFLTDPGVRAGATAVSTRPSRGIGTGPGWVYVTDFLDRSLGVVRG